jgi:hypothetical protein
MFEACGSYFGPKDDQIGPHQTNILGFFESHAVREQLQRPYFRRIGKDPFCRRPLPTEKDIIIEPDWRDRFFRAVPGATAHKECKIILYWEQWHDAFPDAKWVIIRRDRAEIIESVTKRTSFMAGRLTPAQYEKWIDRHIERMDQLKACHGLSWIEIDSGDMLCDDFQGIRSAIKWCGLEWNDNCPALVRPDVTYQVKQ